MIPQTSASELVSGTHRTKPTKVSTTLDPEDVADLRAYAKEDGIYMPDHSTFAAALLRAELTSMGCTGCRQCGGNKARSGRGFVLKNPEETKKPRNGFRKRAAGAPKKTEPKNAKLYKIALRDYRKKQAKRHGWMVATTPRQRDQLRARGNEAYTRAEIALFFPDLPELLLKLCSNCKGKGTIPRKSKARATKPLTARPTGSSKQPMEGGGAEMDEEALHRRGKTDRRLAEVRKRLELSGKADKYWVRARLVESGDVGHGVLETYFMPGNETLKSLWPFTKHGQMLLDAPNPNNLTVRARVTALLDAVHLSQDREKRGWIDLADREAQTLLELYITTWNTIVAELVARSAVARNGRSLAVGAKVMILSAGKPTPGEITGQAREYWQVSVNDQVEHMVAGWHLERVA